MAGKETVSESQRNKNEGSASTGKSFSWIHILEEQRWMEVQACRRQKEEVIRKSQRSAKEETRGIKTAVSDIYQTEPDNQRMDQLLPNRKYERIH